MGRNAVRLVVPEGTDDGGVRGEVEVGAQYAIESPGAEVSPVRPVTPGGSEPGSVRVRIGPAVGDAEHREGSASAPAWLVVSENHLQGWHGTLDGKPCRIYRADGMNMAVRIPDGQAHEVQLWYFPPGLAAGACISIAVLMVASLAAALGLRRRSLSLTG